MKSNLIQAIQEDNIEQVEKEIKTNINIADLEFGGSILHWAAGFGSIEIINLLIKQGIEINKLDNDGQTALHWALGEGNTEVANLLIENNINENIRDRFGSSAHDLGVKRLQPSSSLANIHNTSNNTQRENTGVSEIKNNPVPTNNNAIQRMSKDFEVLFKAILIIEEIEEEGNLEKLAELGECFHNIKWRDEDPNCIRNKYGFIDRSQSSEKTRKRAGGIDFEQLGYLKDMLDIKSPERLLFLEVIKYALNEPDKKYNILEALKELKGKIYNIFQNELPLISSFIPKEDLENYKSIVNRTTHGNISKSNIVTSCQPLAIPIVWVTSFYHDYRCLAAIKAYLQLEHFENIDLQNNKTDRYHIAYIFVKIGERSREISDRLKSWENDDENKGVFGKLFKKLVGYRNNIKGQPWIIIKNSKLITLMFNVIISERETLLSFINLLQSFLETRRNLAPTEIWKSLKNEELLKNDGEFVLGIDVKLLTNNLQKGLKIKKEAKEENDEQKKAINDDVVQENQQSSESSSQIEKYYTEEEILQKARYIIEFSEKVIKNYITIPEKQRGQYLKKIASSKVAIETLKGLVQSDKLEEYTRVLDLVIKGELAAKKLFGYVPSDKTKEAGKLINAITQGIVATKKLHFSEPLEQNKDFRNLVDSYNEMRQKLPIDLQNKSPEAFYEDERNNDLRKFVQNSQNTKVQNDQKSEVVEKLKVKEKSKDSNDDSKIFIRLHKEIKFQRLLHKLDSKKAHHAKATSTGFLGGYIDKLYESENYKKIFEELSHPELDSSMRKVLYTRHKVIMHGFHQNDLEIVSKVSNEEVVPWEEDIDSIVNILKIKILTESEKALEKLAKLIELDPIYLLKSLHNRLGLAYSKLGKLDKAQSHYQKSLELFYNEITSNLELENKTNVMHNLADIYREKDDFQNVLKILEEVVQIRREIFESNNKRLLDTINNLGVAYSNAGEEDKAEQCYREVLKYDDNMTAQSNLAILLSDKGMYSESIILLQKVIEKQESLSEINVRILITNYMSLCSIYHEISDITNLELYYNKINDLFVREVTKLKSEYGRNYSTLVFSIYREKATLDMSIGKYEEAIKNYKYIIKTYSEKIDPITLGDVYKELGVCLSYIDNGTKALKYLKLSEELYKKNNLVDEMKYALLLNCIGLGYSKAGDHQESYNYYVKALSILESLQAPARVHAQTHLNLSCYFLKIEDFTNAKIHADLSLHLNESAFKLSVNPVKLIPHVELVKCYITLASYYVHFAVKQNSKIGENYEAYLKSSEEYLQKANSMCKEMNPNETHSIFFDIFCSFNELYLLMENYELSLFYANKALDIYKLNKFNIITSKVVLVYNNIIELYVKQDNLNAVRDIGKEALSLALETGKKKLISNIYSNLHLSAYYLNYYAEAISYAKQGIKYVGSKANFKLEIYYELGKTAKNYARFINNWDYDNQHASIWYKKAYKYHAEGIKCAYQIAGENTDILYLLLTSMERTNYKMVEFFENKIQPQINKVSSIIETELDSTKCSVKTASTELKDCYMLYLGNKFGYKIPPRPDEFRSIEEIIKNRILTRILDKYIKLEILSENIYNPLSCSFKLPLSYKPEHIKLVVREKLGITLDKIEKHSTYYSIELPVKIVREHYESLEKSQVQR
ncbi:tetratricopeptide repeat protein [Candidatus Jidaibacter acanthamoebae]|nr:tetratricopeptide repeat protein [Candidatus Jidaibacter acanthamoeba]